MQVDKERRHAERFAERWVILSAKYGFIEPEFTIPQNYNINFYDADAISIEALQRQVVTGNLAQFNTVGVLGSGIYWRRAEKAFNGSTESLRHINGNVGYPPQFLRLVNDLITNGHRRLALKTGLVYASRAGVGPARGYRSQILPLPHETMTRKPST